MRKFALYLSAILICCTACDKFISADISAEVLEVHSPIDTIFTREGEVFFWWEENPKIEKYRLIIASPDFLNPDWLVLDSIFYGNKLVAQFEEGVYSWKLKGVNEGSETKEEKGVFFVDETPPNQANSLHPQEGDTILPQNPDDFFLSWYAEDPPFENGFSFSVKDSVYLYEYPETVNTISKYFVDFEEPDSVNIQGELTQRPAGVASKYLWQVISFDKAGNKKNSIRFSFVVEW